MLRDGVNLATFLTEVRGVKPQYSRTDEDAETGIDYWREDEPKIRVVDPQPANQGTGSGPAPPSTPPVGTQPWPPWWWDAPRDLTGSNRIVTREPAPPPPPPEQYNPEKDYTYTRGPTLVPPQPGEVGHVPSWNRPRARSMGEFNPDLHLAPSPDGEPTYGRHEPER